MDKKWYESDWVFDLESYPNVFSMCIVHASGNHMRVFEISDRKNEIEGIAKCLRYLIQNNCRMVGFNNLSYDYTLIHEIISNLKEAKRTESSPTITAQKLYKLTTQIITKMQNSDDKWYGIRESEHFIQQVDLYKIHHMDNVAKATSLKMLEVNMRSKNVEDLPFPVGKTIPPLWGNDSFNNGAGMNTLPMLSSFVYWNMPFENSILIRLSIVST